MNREEMGDGKVSSATGGEADVLVAKKWLETLAAKTGGVTKGDVWAGRPLFGPVVIPSSLHGFRVSRSTAGRISCSFRAPPYLADEEGNWHAGAVAAVMDSVVAMAITSAEGHAKNSVDFSISYFYPAKIGEEVEVDARVVGHKDEDTRKLTAATVEVRKKGSRALVAVGRQWTASARPLPRRSNL